MNIEFLESENILEYRADAIVNPGNVDLWINSSIGQELLIYGGDSIELEALAQLPVIQGEAIVTSAGKLKNFNIIIHAIVYGREYWFPTYQSIEQGMYNSLAMANEYKVKSIIIPLLGEVNRKINLEGISQAMLSGLRRFLKDYPKSSIEEIKFIIPEEEALDVFFSVFAKSQEKV